jgi:hypothetical protein
MFIVRPAFQSNHARSVCDHQRRKNRLQHEHRRASRADCEVVLAGADFARYESEVA